MLDRNWHAHANTRESNFLRVRVRDPRICVTCVLASNSGMCLATVYAIYLDCTSVLNTFSLLSLSLHMSKRNHLWLSIQARCKYNFHRFLFVNGNTFRKNIYKWRNMKQRELFIAISNYTNMNVIISCYCY